jgi:hypothetical protein
MPAPPAQAAENPFFRVEGVPTPMLQLGVAPARALEPFRLRTAGGTITCRALKLTLSFRGEFERCTAAYSHRPCNVYGHRIVTAMLMSALGFAAPDRTGKLLTVTMPVGGESSRLLRLLGTPESPEASGGRTGSAFATEPLAQVRLGGPRCPVKAATLEGFLVAENLVDGTVVTSEHDEAEAAGIVERMVRKPITTVYVEEGGELVPQRVGLRVFGESATVAGRLETTLATGQDWGIFTAGRVEGRHGCESWKMTTVRLEEPCWLKPAPDQL